MNKTMLPDTTTLNLYGLILVVVALMLTTLIKDKFWQLMTIIFDFVMLGIVLLRLWFNV